MRVTGKRGRIPLACLETSACVLLLLIVLAPAEQMESPGSHSGRAGWERCEEPHELCLRSTTVGLRKREKDLTPGSTDWWSRIHRTNRGDKGDYGVWIV